MTLHCTTERGWYVCFDLDDDEVVMLYDAFLRLTLNNEVIFEISEAEEMDLVSAHL